MIVRSANKFLKLIVGGVGVYSDEYWLWILSGAGKGYSKQYYANYIANNIVPNGSFKYNANGWQGYQSTVTRDTSVYRTAPASLKVQPDTNTVVAYYPAIPTQVGAKYTFTVWVKGTPGNSIYLLVQGTAGSSIPISTTNWVKYQMTITSNATTANVEVHSDANTTPIYLDHANFRKVGDTILSYNGALKKIAGGATPHSSMYWLRYIFTNSIL